MYNCPEVYCAYALGTLLLITLDFCGSFELEAVHALVRHNYTHF